MVKKRKFLEKIKNYKHKEIVAFTIIMFIIYLSTLSCSWDDEDSILFIRGVREFNVAKWQPHPPGYPVYIFFGKISVFLMKDELLGLTILSAIFGALSLAVFYFLIFEMYGKKIALISCMILGVTPLFWLNSLEAMTDMTGLFFILLSMYFIFHSIKYNEIKILYIGSFVSALSVGVRFHSLFIVVPLLIYACFKMKNNAEIKNKHFKKKILLIFFVGVLVWLIPTLIASGFLGYFESALKQFLKRFDRPGMSTLAGDFSFDYLLSKIKYFIVFFLGTGYGINLMGFSIFPVGMLLIYLFFLFLSYEKLKDKRILFFVVGLVFYVIMIFLFLPAHNPRYLLPLIPFISLLFTLGFSWFGKYERLAFLFLFILLLIHAAPLAKEIHEVPSPPVQLMEYIQANYDLDDTFVVMGPVTAAYLEEYGIGYHYPSFLISHSSNKSIKINETLFLSEIEEFNQKYNSRILGEFNSTAYLQEYSNSKYTFNISKTILVISPTEILFEKFNLTLIKTFSRDPRIHPKHTKESLYELKKDS